MKTLMANTKGSALLGLGNDILEIERIRKSIALYEEQFLSRIFTEKEREYCLKYKDPIPHFAGRFSAKEAIVKALGTGIGEHASWKDIEILNDSAGKPVVHFSGALKDKIGNTAMKISISHCETYVTAVAIWCND